MRPSRALLWAGIGLLTAVGVFTAYARATHIDHLTGRHMAPIRARMLAAVGLPDTDPAWDELFATVDRPFAAHPRVTLLHVVPGGLFLLLAPLQLSRRIRRRYTVWHRWSGRLLLPIGAIAAVTGLYFGIFEPNAGMGESIIITIAGTLFLVAAVRAWRAIRRGDVTSHRDWMTRAFAVMFAVPLTRVLGGVIDLAIIGTSVTPLTGFVVDLWLSWGLMIGGAEWWIRRRAREESAVAAEPAGVAATRGP